MMGVKRHEAIIAAIHHDEAIRHFQEKMAADYRRLLIVSKNLGMRFSCVLLPDGSNEGFVVGNRMDKVRIEFIELLKDLDADWAHVVLYDEAAQREPLEGPGPRIIASSRWAFTGKHWKRLRRQD